MCSAEETGEILLGLARRAIAHGLETELPLQVDPDEYPPALREPRATFVTIRVRGDLRGCVGGLEAQRPLVADVARSAFLAAFRDTRFAPLDASEIGGVDDLELHVSVLDPLERLDVADEKQLLDAIRPGVDGLLLRGDGKQGTFLPDVWESLPEPTDFVRELRRKAGLPDTGWSEDWEVFRYGTTSYGEAGHD